MHKGKKRETYASLNEPIMLGEALTPNFGQTFGTFVRSEGPRVALYNRAVVCENYSVITVSLVSQSSAINLSVEMRIPNPKYKGRTSKIPQLLEMRIPNPKYKGRTRKIPQLRTQHICCSTTSFAHSSRTEIPRKL